MRNVKVERTLAAPQSSVWAVLADYPNIVDWNDGVKNSYAIGDAIEGVGAQRQTELVPNGAMRMRETVAEWMPEEIMVIAIDKIEKQPIKQATMTFTLSDGGDHLSLPLLLFSLRTNEQEIEDEHYGSHVQEEHECAIRSLSGRHHDCQ